MNKLLIGYWHNWNEAKVPYIELKDIPEAYNIINVAFLTTNNEEELPIFKPSLPYNKTQSERDKIFISQIRELHKNNKIILLSLGGETANISLKKKQLKDFIKRIEETVTKYNFDGVDLDLENISINARDNVYVISEALKKIKDDYRSKDKLFYITMAPEFPYLRKIMGENSYWPYLKKLEGYYDFISPQFYNQGNDGVRLLKEEIDYFKNKDIHNIPEYIEQNNIEFKAEFLASMIKYMTKKINTDDFYQINESKFLLGLPATEAATREKGNFVNYKTLKKIKTYLEDWKINIRGLMTWSINYDKLGHNQKNWYFHNMYQQLFLDNNKCFPRPLDEFYNKEKHTVRIVGEINGWTKIDMGALNLKKDFFCSNSSYPLYGFTIQSFQKRNWKFFNKLINFVCVLDDFDVFKKFMQKFFTSKFNEVFSFSASSYEIAKVDVYADVADSNYVLKGFKIFKK